MYNATFCMWQPKYVNGQHTYIRVTFMHEDGGTVKMVIPLDKGG